MFGKVATRNQSLITAQSYMRFSTPTKALMGHLKSLGINQKEANVIYNPS